MPEANTVDKNKRFDELTYGVTGKLKRMSYFQDDSGQVYRSMRVATMGATIKINVTEDQYKQQESNVGAMVTCVGEIEYDGKTDRAKFLYGSVTVVK